MTDVVNLADRMRNAPMQVPHASPPKPKLRSSQPPEAAELLPVWTGGDVSLDAVERQAYHTMREAMMLGTMSAACKSRLSLAQDRQQAEAETEAAIRRGHDRARRQHRDVMEIDQ